MKGVVGLGTDRAGRFLPWLVTVLVYLAILAAAVALSVGKMADHWAAGAQNKATVQVPRAIDGDPVQGALALEATLAAVDADPGVARAELLTDDALAALLAPWMGEGGETLDLALPYVIALELVESNDQVIERLRGALSAAAPSALLEDHRGTLDHLLGLVRTIAATALFAMVLLASAMTVTMILIAQMSLAVHSQEIEILHLVGARDTFIAAQFQARALRQGLLGGLLGAAGAALTLLFLDQALAGKTMLLATEPRLSVLDGVFLAMIPLAGAALMVATTRVAVLRGLARLP